VSLDDTPRARRLLEASAVFQSETDGGRRYVIGVIIKRDACAGQK